MPDAIVLDTHVLAWWLADQRKLSKPARRAIDESVRLIVSAISFWEIAMLVGKGRLELDRPTMLWVNNVVEADRVECVPVTATIAVMAASLIDLHGDPADRIIAATALDTRAALVSKDSALRRWADATGSVACLW